MTTALSLSEAKAQGELISSLTIEQGLVNNEVTSLCQDRFGFLWMGTRGGLNRYDGYEFKLIRNPPESGNNFTSQYIEVIHEGESGTLWIGTKNSGLNGYDMLLDTIRHHIPPDSLDFNIQNIQALQETDGQLFIGSSSGLYLYDLSTLNYRCITANLNVLSLLSDGEVLWIGTATGLFHYSIPQKKLRKARWDMPGQVQVTSIAKDPASGILYLGTWRKGVLVADPGRGRVIGEYKHEAGNTGSLSNNNAYRVFLDESGNLWIGTWGGGLNLLDTKKQRIHRYELPAQEDGIPPGHIVLSIMQDRSGILWVGTDGGGVYKVDPRRKRFNNIAFATRPEEQLQDTYIRAVFSNKQGLWVGTRTNGIYLSQDGVRFKKVPTSIPIRSVRGFFENGPDLWVCTDLGLIILSDWVVTGRQRAVLPDRNNPESLSGPKVNTIVRDKDSVIWVGTQESGLNRVIGMTADGIPRFKRYLPQPGKPDALQNERISCMLSDSKGRLWVGTYHGLHLYDHARDQFRVYRQRKGDPSSLSNNAVLCITEDRHGDIWIGTQHGFNRLRGDRKENYHFESYFARNGFPNDYIHAIQADRQGNIWMSTNQGIVRYTVTRNEFHNFDTRDGLISNIFSENSSFVSEEGLLFFGNSKGVTSFVPDSIRLNGQVPPVYLTGLKVNNEEVTVGDTVAGRRVLSTAVFAARSITLSYKQNIVTLSFAALDYHAPDKNQYRYKLSGFDQDWVYAGDHRQATYTNLPPGSYTFTVMASNSDKIWNEEGATLEIRILPPPWKTWWAYAIYLVLIIAFLWISRSIGISRIKLRNNLEIANLNYQREREIAEVRSKLFTNVSHEFRTPLTLMMGPLHELANNSGLEQGLQRTLNRILNHARRMLHLVNQLLAVQKADASNLSLHIHRHNLTSVLRYVADAFSDESERRNIRFAVDSPASLYFSFDKEKIEIVLYNLLSNAFKFTPDGGFVSLSARKSLADTGDAYCTIEVKDTGSGITEKEQERIFERFYRGCDHSATNHITGTGVGLAFVRELVDLHGGQIAVNSAPDRGSTFRVTLPATGSDPELPGQDPDAVEAAAVPENENQVLIVEDNPEIREYMASLLGRLYRVLQASDGQQGMELACSALPDLIISDIMMPVRDGFSLCQQLRQDQRTSHIPIILLTARSDDDAYIEGIDKGADVYLTKPFNPQVLKSYVKNLITLRTRLRDQFARQINLEPDQNELGSYEADFIKQVIAYTEEHMGSRDFNTDMLASASNMSRSTFYRKLKAITGLSGSEFIKLVRLRRSAALLKSGKFNITQAAYETGFNDLKHFRRSFQQQFGLTPSEYLKQHKTSIKV